jgi:hypothetical protein
MQLYPFMLPLLSETFLDNHPVFDLLKHAFVFLASLSLLAMVSVSFRV